MRHWFHILEHYCLIVKQLLVIFGLFSKYNSAMDFWTRLKLMIRENNTTQEWVARRIGVPFGTFRKWLTRKTYPNAIESVKIAKLLNTSVEYLVMGNNIEGLSTSECELLEAYRRLNKNDQENIVLAIAAWLKK